MFFTAGHLVNCPKVTHDVNKNDNVVTVSEFLKQGTLVSQHFTLKVVRTWSHESDPRSDLLYEKRAV